MNGELLRRTLLEVVRDLGNPPDSIVQSAGILGEAKKRLGLMDGYIGVASPRRFEPLLPP
jgi:hypothetical protein